MVVVCHKVFKPKLINIIFIVNCNVPILNCHIGLDYNSTLEGSLLAFWCEDGFIPRGVITAVCHSNASWIPDPTQHVCATLQSGLVL